MSKTLRRLVRVIGAIVLVFVLVLVAVRLFVPADKLAGIIAQRIEAATGGTAGFVSAEVDVWPSLRLVLSDGAVVGTGAALTAKTGTQVDVESYAARFRRLEVSLAWGPLFARRLEVGKVHLVEPSIELVTRVEDADPAAAGESGRSGETAGAPTTAPMPVAEIPPARASARFATRPKAPPSSAMPLTAPRRIWRVSITPPRW